MTATTAHTRNAHDNGLDIATGQDIAAGTVIGRIFWDDTPDNAGLVLRVHDSEDMPDSADEAIRLIEDEYGYLLDPSSIEDIRALAP